MNIKISTTLRKYIPAYDPEKGLEYALDTNREICAREVAIQLGLPLEEIKFIMINGKHAPLDAPLNPQDRLAFFPPVGGG